MIHRNRRKEISLILRPGFKITVLAVAFLLLFAVLLWIPGLFSSFLLSIIFVFLLSPAVDFFERHGVTRIQSISIVFALILAGTIILTMLLSNTLLWEYQDFVSKLDTYSGYMGEEIQRRIVELEQRFGLARFGAGSKLTHLAQEAFAELVSYSGATFNTIITWITLVPLTLFFFLLDGYRIKRSIIGFLPNRYFEMSLNIQEKISNIIGNFIRAKLIECSVVGFCALAGFIVVGIIFSPLNYLIFLAFLVGLLNIIPYVGPVLGMIPVMFIAIVQYVLMPQFPELSGTGNIAPSWTPVLAIGGAVVFAHVVDNVYLIPVLLGHSVNVHALVVLLAVIVGFEMLGMTGLIISIPVAAIIQTLLFEISEGMRNLRH